MFFFLLAIAITLFIYSKYIKPCTYWKERDIKCAKSWPIVGSMGKVLSRREAFANIAWNLYKQHPNERYVGYMQFTQQCLLIRDINLIKQICIKDFSHFTDLALSGQGTTSDPIIGKCLISLTGEKWKQLRATLSPAFTSSKMKNMYVLMDKCSGDFVQKFDTEVELEMKETFTKFACNVIASTAFGIKIDCLTESNNEFFEMGALLKSASLGRTIRTVLSQMFPKLAQIFKVEILPKKATTFFRSIIKDNIQKRELEGIVRPDLIHLLMEARGGKLKHKDEEVTKTELTDDHIVAQAILFFLAGFDTISTTTSFMAHELAVNPDIQKKLQEEIDDVRREYNDKISIDGILEMKYLDQVVSETLRLWPAGFEADRLCIQDYVIQPMRHAKEKAFLVKKGIDVVFPILAIHRDPHYYDEPNCFNPDRFSDENKPKIVPGSYMPFGCGPRNCIGSRFAVLEIKTLFCHLLAKFDIVPNAKTEIPIKISPLHFNLQPEKGFWLSLRSRKKKYFQN